MDIKQEAREWIGTLEMDLKIARACIEEYRAEVDRLEKKLTENHDDTGQHKAIVEILDRQGWTSTSKSRVPLKTLGRICELLSAVDRLEKENINLKIIAESKINKLHRLNGESIPM